jgi:hypothetical protein
MTGGKPFGKVTSSVNSRFRGFSSSLFRRLFLGQAKPPRYQS